MANVKGSKWSPVQEFACKTCDKKITARKPRIYCSKTCNDARNGGRKVLNCENCGKEFRRRCRSARDANRFCSRKCGSAGRRKPELPKLCNVYFANCLICSRLFASRFESKRLCSRECRLESCRRLSRKLAEAKSRRDHSERPCSECGSLFQPLYGDGRRRFCSKRCCYAEAHRNGKAQRKSKQSSYAMRAEYVSKAALIGSSNGRCYLCDELLWSNVHKAHPLAPTVDHVIPLAANGQHLKSNCMVAHFICNTFKGNRPVTHRVTSLCRVAVQFAKAGKIMEAWKWHPQKKWLELFSV